MGSVGEATSYQFADCELDLGARELRRSGQACALEPQVFDLLAYLVVHSDRLVGKDELNQNIWQGRFVTDASLTTAIKHARQAIGDDGKTQALIRTLPRRGFRFVGAVETRVVTDKPKIAVLPFENMSADPEQAYFTDGMTDDLITQSIKDRRLVRDLPQFGFRL